MDINFELYKIFYHAASTGSFSGAAARLFITQSAVSQSIRSLEEKTGHKLFYRKSRNVRLTPEGALLFKHIEQAYNFIRTGQSKLREMQELGSGEIRLGASDTVCRYFLIPYLESFIKKYPKIKLQVINRTSPQLVDLLKNGNLDVGIVTLPVKDKSLETRPFMTVSDMFVASGRFRELNGIRISLKELSRYPLLLLEKSSATRQNLDAFLGENGISVVPEIELESIDLLVEFARIGLGIAHVLRESAGKALGAGEVFEVRTEEKLPARSLGIITAKNVPLSKAAGEFIGELSNDKNH